MKKTLIWGFHRAGQAMAIESLQKRGRIDIVCWIGKSRKCDIDILDLYKQRFSKESYSGLGAEHYQEIYRKWLATFLEMYSRVPTTREMSVHELVNAFNIFYDYIAALLIHRKVELVLINNLPHFGVDLILYALAEKMHIKTVILSQSLVPNRCFYLYRLEDFGAFEDVEPLGAELGLKIESQHKEKLFYMGAIPFKKRYCIPIMLHEVRRILLRRRSRKTLTSVLRTFRECRQYKKNVATNCKEVLDIKRNYVYFPLHLQPELSTSALGGMYTDQLLALEYLSKLLPEGWFVYVKENPKQREEQRGELFFRRLMILHNVVLISPNANTYTLINNCRFVATISGTAGWEAISAGKCVLVFGKAWYRKLPGVFEYQDSIKLEDIVSHSFDHETLEREYNRLIQKTVPGVVDHDYEVLVRGYTHESNAEILATSIETVIDKFPPDSQLA